MQPEKALVQDQASGNQSLFYRVHRQGQTFQGVGAQQRRGAVRAKDYQGSHTLAINGCSGFSLIHEYPPTVGQQKPALARRLNPNLTQHATGQSSIGCAGIHRGIQIPGSLPVHAGNSQWPVECSHNEF